jgi:Family of unknown function (DUF6299)
VHPGMDGSSYGAYVVTPSRHGVAHEDSGRVTVSGTYRCGARASELVVLVTQSFGGGTIRASMHVEGLVGDGSAQQWSVTDGAFDGSFLPGPATVHTLLLDTSNPINHETLAESSTTVELRRSQSA